MILWIYEKFLIFPPYVLAIKVWVCKSSTRSKSFNGINIEGSCSIIITARTTVPLLGSPKVFTKSAATDWTRVLPVVDSPLLSGEILAGYFSTKTPPLQTTSLYCGTPERVDPSVELRLYVIIEFFIWLLFHYLFTLHVWSFFADFWDFVFTPLGTPTIFFST